MVRNLFALRIATKWLEALWYNLMMFGVPIEGPADLFCDTKLVVTNSTISTLILNKKHNSRWSRRVREVQAATKIRIAWIDGDYNLSDIFIKTSITTERDSKRNVWLEKQRHTPIQISEHSST